MNVDAIESTSATRAPTLYISPARKTAPARPARVVSMVQSTLAATVTLTEVPASVKPDERALYMQILKSVGGNTAVALAMLQARQTPEAAG